MNNTQEIDKLKEEIFSLLKKHYEIDKQIESSVTNLAEQILNKNKFNTTEEIITWFEKRVETCNFKVSEINLKDVRSWYADKEKGNILHESKGFFKIIGVRVSNAAFREQGSDGWDQPMIDQGVNSSVVGLIRKKFNGIYHYLIQAKAEPGNYGTLQLSPTLQVTYSNLNQMHKGRKPYLSEYFEDDNNQYKVLYKQWLPEDGGRFYKKRVLNMLVELDENQDIEIKEDFIWVTLSQIKELLKKDNMVNPHVRSIIAHL